MSFWLYDPISIKDSTLFPSGSIGNFLNTVTIAIMALVAIVKTRFQNLMDDQNLDKVCWNIVSNSNIDWVNFLQR